MSGSLPQIAMLVNLEVVRVFDRERLDAARSLSWSFGPYYTLPLVLAAILYVVGFFRMRVRLRQHRLSWSPLLIFTNAAACVLHAIAQWAWHGPTLFEATLDGDFIHGVQHVSLLGPALLFWWALIDGHPGRLTQGSAVLYVFATAVHTSVLGA